MKIYLLLIITLLMPALCLGVDCECAMPQSSNLTTPATKHPRADAHAPIGVMGDHMHKAGNLMASYRYMFMNMDGIRSGTTDLSSEQVFSDYMVAPTEMTMQMHMVGVMYAPRDWLTFILMGGYQIKDMAHVTRAGSMARMMRGASFTRHEEGFGDLMLTSLWRIYHRKSHHVHGHLGVSMPTATESDFPYPMQNGSGTWDLKIGLTWTYMQSRYSLGSQIMGTFRYDENDRGYRFPNLLDASAWVARPFTNWLSASARISYQNQGDFHGRDRAITMFMSPQMNAENLPSDRIDLSLGVNVLAPGKQRVGLEVGMPLYEETDGPRLSTEWWVMLGIKKSW